MHETKTAPARQELRLEARIEHSPYQPDAYDRSVDGVIKLTGNIEASMRAVRADWRANITREELERLAAPHIERMNSERDELGAAPLELSAISDKFLAGVVEPNWEAAMPTDSDDEERLAAWEQLKTDYPDLAPNLEDWYMYHSRLHILRNDTELMAKVDSEWRGEKLAATRAAHEFMGLEYQRKGYSEQMALIRVAAAKTGRRLTPGEGARLKALQRQMDEAEASVHLLGETTQDKYLAEVDRLMRLEDKRQLESGLLMTAQMEQIIKEAVSGLMAGKPALFVGHTGGAKTLLAMHIARRYICREGDEPEFIRGHADITATDLIGRTQLRERNGATITDFGDGPIARAAEEGRPVIIDEANAILPETLKSLNPVMQLRPGDTFILHEDSGKRITVKQGFCIILTANEKSKQYKGVDDFSVDFQNRLGTAIHRIHYPDHDDAFWDAHPENERLAFAAVCTDRGEFPDDIDPADFDQLVKAAFVSQQIFNGVHGDGYNDYIPSNRRVDRKPGLEETVLAPRTLVDLLKDVAGSYGEVSIKRACERFLDGIKNENDRDTMHTLLDLHKLLPSKVGK